MCKMRIKWIMHISEICEQCAKTYVKTEVYQEAVTAYLNSKELLAFVSALQHSCYSVTGITSMLLSVILYICWIIVLDF